PAVGGFIVDNTTWRWVFYVNLPIGIAGIIIVLGAVGVLRPTSRKRFDTLGSALLAGWVSAFMLALLENSDSGWAWSDARIVGLLGATVILFIGFVLWELEDKEPVVPLRFFAQRVVSASSSIAFLRGTVLITVSTFVSILVAYVLGGTPDAIRDTLYFFVVPLVIGSLIGGQLLPRLTYRVLSVTGMALMSVGTLLLTTFRETTPTWQFSYLILPTGGLGLYLIPTGFGVGMTFAVTALAIQYAVPPKDIGAASSLVQFLANLGGAVGLALFSSYAQGRITSLDPVPNGLNCPIPPASAPNVGCFPYYSALPHAMAIAYSETFYFLVAVSLVAFFSAWFITGRLPKTRGMPMPGTGSGSSLPSGTAGGAPSAVSGSR
ncbi:MAG TPA: MFS transporter, partial [Thermoplasmata archaeon]|nr:MFS transporter [Thermoplasmata archaeon]